MPDCTLPVCRRITEQRGVSLTDHAHVKVRLPHLASVTAATAKFTTFPVIMQMSVLTVTVHALPKDYFQRFTILQDRRGWRRRLHRGR